MEGLAGVMWDAKRKCYVCPKCETEQVENAYTFCKVCWPKDRDERAMAMAAGPYDIARYWREHPEALAKILP